MFSTLTRDEVERRVNRLTESELEQMHRQVGLPPKCKCLVCRNKWTVKVNRFLRAVEAARN